jgi:hypothetical protein
MYAAHHRQSEKWTAGTLTYWPQSPRAKCVNEIGTKDTKTEDDSHEEGCSEEEAEGDEDNSEQWVQARVHRGVNGLQL